MGSHGNSTDAYLEWPFRVVSSIFWAPLAVIGIGGNLMVILVVMHVRGMKTPTNCYLVSLAAADCLFFISSTPVELSSIHLPEDVFLFGRVGCSILRFLPFLSMNASSLSITAFTVERYIGICHPMKARYICTVKRAQLIIIIIWSCSILYNSTWLFLTDLKPLNYTDWPNAYQCTYSLNRASYKAVFLLDLFVFYWIPLVLYLILYTSMARILIKARFFTSSSYFENGTISSKHNSSQSASLHTTYTNNHRSVLGCSSQPPLASKQSEMESVRRSPSTSSVRPNLRMNSDKGSPGECRSPLLNCASPADDQSQVSGQQSHRASGKNDSDDEVMKKSEPTNQSTSQRRVRNTGSRLNQIRESKAYYGESLNKARVQVVKMLIVIVVVFALFWLPYRGLVVYNSFTKKPWIDKWYLLFAKTMVMVNCAINPVLYNLMSGKFREAFLLMFKQCFRRGTQSSQFNSDAPSTAMPNSAASGFNLYHMGLKKHAASSQMLCSTPKRSSQRLSANKPHERSNQSNGILPHLSTPITLQTSCLTNEDRRKDGPTVLRNT